MSLAYLFAATPVPILDPRCLNKTLRSAHAKNTEDIQVGNVTLISFDSYCIQREDGFV